MQEFIAERNNGTTTTTAVDQALMKTFKDASAIDLAIQAGIVNEGEIISTIEDDKPHSLPIDQLREMQEEIRELQEASSGSASSVTAAIQALDVAEAGGTNKYIKAISETDGKISATEGTIDTTVTASSDNLITSGAVNSALSASETTLQGNINAVNAKISSTASSSDKVPAMSEVTSAISTAIGTEVSNRNDAISTAITTEVGDRNDAISAAISTEVSNRNTAITNAINGLDVADAGGTGKFIKAISQTDGKISATEGTLSMKLEGNDLYITFA